MHSNTIRALPPSNFTEKIVALLHPGQTQVSRRLALGPGSSRRSGSFSRRVRPGTKLWVCGVFNVSTGNQALRFFDSRSARPRIRAAKLFEIVEIAKNLRIQMTRQRGSRRDFVENDRARVIQ